MKKKCWQQLMACIMQFPGPDRRRRAKAEAGQKCGIQFSAKAGGGRIVWRGMSTQW